MHIHLDLVGGIAGDMFVAALLDAFPDRVDSVINAVRLAGLDHDIVTRVMNFGDGVLVGKRFDVHKAAVNEQHRPEPAGENRWLGHEDNHRRHRRHHDHAHQAGHTHHSHAQEQPAEHAHAHDNEARQAHHHHDHTHWAKLKEQLSASQLPDGVKRRALGIFGELAWAEARVHGKEIDAVTFHEVGNWDSIADIVAAATLIDALSVDSWSVGSLPIGQGRVSTAHGELPVPAPATSLLLEGFAFHHDGRPGERVTPTGAAILRYLAPQQGVWPLSRVLRSSGHGFGTRKLAGMSNVLRVLVFDAVADTSATADTVGIIQFEIDDQSGEDLAVALDHIRASPGIVDVTQGMVVGKKGRTAASIQVLVKPSHMDDAIACCFRQTTTLGVRTRVETRTILVRKEMEIDGLRVKISERPDGKTAKAASDDVATDARGHQARSATRRAAEDIALRSKQ